MEKPDILGFLKDNPYPDDEQYHAYAKSLGIEPDELEKDAYGIISTFSAGGEAYKKGITFKDVDQKQLSMGIDVEYEHVDSNSPFAKLIASRIALDHLAEIPDYYDRLKEMENEAMVKEDLRNYIIQLHESKAKLGKKVLPWVVRAGLAATGAGGYMAGSAAIPSIVKKVKERKKKKGTNEGAVKSAGKQLWTHRRMLRKMATKDFIKGLAWGGATALLAKGATSSAKGKKGKGKSEKESVKSVVARKVAGKALQKVSK
jgi:hypothetical protein